MEVSELEPSARFYDAVLGSLGWRRHIDDDELVAWGIVRPVFFASSKGDGGPGSGMCASPPAASRRSRPPGRVGWGRAGPTTGRPGRAPSTVASYYSAYLRDPDGHRVEIAVQSN